MSFISSFKDNIKEKSINKAYKMFIDSLTRIKTNVNDKIYNQDDLLFISGLKSSYERMIDGLPKLYRNNIKKQNEEKEGWNSLIYFCDQIIDNWEIQESKIILENVEKLIEVMKLSLEEEKNRNKYK